MGTKIIIICGILAVATILLGLFRLRWLRKCYDKARAEKRDVLPSEQTALADKRLKTYHKAKDTTWKCIGIAFAVIAILGTAVWGFNRIAQAPKAETKTEITSEYSCSWLDYLGAYFNEEKAIEYYGAKTILNFEKTKAVYEKCLADLIEAEKEDNLIEKTIYNTRLQNAKKDFEKAQKDIDSFHFFPMKWRENSKLSWLFLAMLSIAILDTLIIKKKKQGTFTSTCACVASMLLTAIGLALPLEVELFTLRNALCLVLAPVLGFYCIRILLY